MGIANVRAALAVGSKVSAPARLTLAVMAVHALDRDIGQYRARLYYGGPGLICASQGEYPDEAAQRRVRRLMADLVEAGLIERLARAAPGRRAVYRLHLDPVDNPGDKGAQT